MRRGIFALFLLCANVCYSGESTGVATGPVVQDGLVLFYAGPHTNAPTCSGGTGTTIGEWAFDGKTDAGKVMLSVLLSAQARGKAISVLGKNVCDVWGDRESVLYIYVN